MAKPRDVTKTYPVKQFISKIRRLADGLEKGEQFTIQIANERIRVPKHAVVNIEHERGKDDEEIEFQIVWKNSE
jgi:amphi-Trp domain-containing protein